MDFDFLDRQLLDSSRDAIKSFKSAVEQVRLNTLLAYKLAEHDAGPFEFVAVTVDVLETAPRHRRQLTRIMARHVQVQCHTVFILRQMCGVTVGGDKGGDRAGRVLRRSGTFSLKARPSTVTTLSFTVRP